MGRLKSVLPVLKQSHLFLFSCLLMATGNRDILDIIPTVVDRGLVLSVVVFSVVVVQHSGIYQLL